MSLHGSGDRHVVARGRIRVDARRAIAKLREHLLVDLHLYAREIVRSAIAGGARNIDVQYDADDVIFTFDGDPIGQALLPRLLDHVIGEATTPEARRLRAMALGVNAALGLRPAFVDAIIAGGEGRCIRMRWTPAMLDTGGELGEAPACESIAAPSGMPPRTIRVHLRRRVGWNVVRRAIAGDQPPEIVLLAEATHYARAKLTLSGEPFPHAPRPPALVRVPFYENGLTYAALEIVPPLSGPPHIEFLEHGIVLIRKRWTSAPAFPDEPFAALDLPVRVIADAPELPTNASRSALREDASLPRRTAEAALQAFRDARAALTSVVLGQGEIPAGVEIIDRDPVRLEDALGNLVCIVAGAFDRGVPLPEEALALLRLPLLRDALGGPLAPASLLARDRKAPLYVWTGKTALPKEMSYWMREVIWLRGRTVEKLFAFFRLADATQLFERAQTGLERRRTLLAHPASEPSVAPAPDHLIREAFRVKEGPFVGLRGEVAVRRPSSGKPHGAIFRIFLEGRHIHTMEVDASKIPLPLDCALCWEGHLRPTFRFDAIEPDRFLRLALWYAVRVGIMAINGLAERLAPSSDHEAQLSELAPLLRAAAGARVVSTESLGIDRAPPDPPIMTYSAIWHANVWPTTDPDKPTSLARLGVYAHRTGAICTAPPQTKGSAPDMRPVIALRRAELQWIKALLPDAGLVPYAQALVSPEAHEARRRAAFREAIGQPHHGLVMDFSRPGIRGQIALSTEARLTFLHAGRPVHSQAPPEELGPVTIVVDDDTMVPAPDFSAIRWQAACDWLAHTGHDFLLRILSAVQAGPPGILDGTGGRLVRAYLIHSSATTGDPALRAQIDELAIISMLDERGEEMIASLSSVAAIHPPPDPIPYLCDIPGFETLDWCPLILKLPVEVAALKRWSNQRIVPAEQQLPARQEAARVDRERRAFFKKPLLDLHAVGDMADPDAHISFHGIADSPPDMPPTDSADDITIAAAMPHLKLVHEKGALGPSQDICVAAALPRQGFEITYPFVDVLVEGRFLCLISIPRLKLPVVARIGLSSHLHVIPWHGLTDIGIEAVAARVHETAHMLALELLDIRSASPGAAPWYADIRLLRLIAALLCEPAAPGSTADAGPLVQRLFGDATPWPAVQGEEYPWKRLKPSVCGRIWYPAWRGPAKGRADLDVPILYLPPPPEGTLIESIVAQAGIVLDDVTGMVERLQAARAAKDSREPPRLPGKPPHPLLRTTLQDAGVTTAEGEMEIVPGPASEVVLVGLDGIARRVDAELPVALRVVARGEFIDMSKASIRPVLLELAKGARYHLTGPLASRLHELPDFVRAHLMRILCKTAGGQAKKMPKTHVRWEVIPDTSGAYHSLKSLQEDPGVQWSYTTGDPPYPERDYGLPVLRLTADDARALSKRISLKDITGIMQRHRQAEARANAPPVEAIRLTDEQREKCLDAVMLNSDTTTGEIGILTPEQGKSRGIAVHTARRPLCNLSDMPGWPILAVVNDDGLEPNAAFTAIRKTSQKYALRERVRAAADEALDAWLAPPEDALGVCRLHRRRKPDDAAFDVAGTLYLPSAWPHAPHVQMRIPGLAVPVSQSLVVETFAPALSGIVPVAGTLLLRLAHTKSSQHTDTLSDRYMQTGPHMQALADIALREAALWVAQALKEGSSPVLEAYQWNLRLLGAQEAGEPSAPTSVQGRHVTADDILLELSMRGRVWFTRRAGDTEGDFPDDVPSFILFDDGTSALIEVLRRRAPGALFELGGRSAPEEAVPQATPELVPDPFLSVPIDEQAANNPRPPEPFGLVVPAAPVATWFGGLVRRVAAVVSSMAPEPEPPVPAEARALLLNTIDGLRLTVRAVESIEYVRRGRPVRYDRAKSRLLLNRNHPAIQSLVPRAHKDPRALALLVCAAVSEINRALDVVTDADERRALIELL